MQCTLPSATCSDAASASCDIMRLFGSLLRSRPMTPSLQELDRLCPLEAPGRDSKSEISNTWNVRTIHTQIYLILYSALSFYIYLAISARAQLTDHTQTKQNIYSYSSYSVRLPAYLFAYLTCIQCHRWDSRFFLIVHNWTLNSEAAPHMFLLQEWEISDRWAKRMMICIVFI